MSVKRLSYLKLLPGYTTGRLKEVQKDWSHAQKKLMRTFFATPTLRK